MLRKTLDNTNVQEAECSTPDLRIYGNGNLWECICKASSEAEGWMKSTKAMEIAGVGCLVQVTTQQGESIAEALTFIPGVKIAPCGTKLVALSTYEKIE